MADDKVFFGYLVCMTAYHHSQRRQAELLGPGKQWFKCQNFPDILGLVIVIGIVIIIIIISVIIIVIVLIIVLILIIVIVLILD